MPEADQQALRLGLLSAAADPGAPVPDAAAAAEGLEGNERSAMLMQLFYTSLGDKSRIRTEDINTFKKGIRDKALQLNAFRMTANREVSWLGQFVISNSRTVVLAGIILALDAALLAFLMASGRSWHFDVKWIIILVIVDFLLLFQLMPLVYMVIKAFFPESFCSSSSDIKIFN